LRIAKVNTKTPTTFFSTSLEPPPAVKGAPRCGLRWSEAARHAGEEGLGSMHRHAQPSAR
ncbi:MAG: hypothetical protein MZV70_64505, partial [Desulfobacterales bacterium]|nr:hypothetical protein [Desulfobacterales bacterium]